MRLLYSAMASTSSGSYLISSHSTGLILCQAPCDWDTSPIARVRLVIAESRKWWSASESSPAWRSAGKTHTHSLQVAQQQTHMWNLVIEGSQAQLIVQGLGLAKLMESLEVKEKKKMTDHSTLFPGGNGHVLTNSDFIKAMEDQWQMQVDEEEGWRQRQAARAEMREEKEKLNDQSQQIKQVHQRVVDDGIVECVWLTANWSPKEEIHKWSKWPKWPLKLTIASVATLSQGVDDELDEQSMGNDDDFI